MRKAFKASRLMGLLALLAGFMAFSATAAQAEPGAYWLVAGKDIGTSLLPEIKAVKETEGTLLSKIGLSKVEISCPSISFKGAKLHQLGSATGKIHFEGCKTKLNGTLANACEPHSPTAGAGLIETNALDALIKLHPLEGKPADETVELLPTAGETFVTLEMGASCAIGTKIDIKGKFFIWDCQNEGLVDKEIHLIEEFKALPKLLFGGNAATIDGSAFVSLAGAHTGMTFAGHAG